MLRQEKRDPCHSVRSVTKVSSEHMTSGISAVMTLPCSSLPKNKPEHCPLLPLSDVLKQNMGKLSRKIQKSFLYLMRVLPLWFTQADYSKAFLEAHREKITLHKAPRRAAISPPGPFLFSDIFPTVGKRGRIGAKLIYDQQEGENQDGNGLYRRRMPLGRTAFF